MSPVDWLLAISLVYSHSAEPRNPAPRAMARELAEVMLAETTDREELGRGVVYAFREGSYSPDPHLAGDCRGLPAGSTRCTTALGAQHWSTWQVSPEPATLAEAWKRALGNMRTAIAKCPAFPMSLYVSGLCADSRTARQRERDVKALLEVPE